MKLWPVEKRACSASSFRGEHPLLHFRLSFRIDLTRSRETCRGHCKKCIRLRIPGNGPSSMIRTGNYSRRFRSTCVRFNIPRNATAYTDGSKGSSAGFMCEFEMYLRHSHRERWGPIMQRGGDDLRSCCGSCSCCEVQSSQARGKRMKCCGFIPHLQVLTHSKQHQAKTSFSFNCD